MEFASVALRTLLPKLAQLLQDEYGLQTGAKKGIQFLYEELERTQAALRQVGEVPLEQLSELVRLWARDVREVSCDMEDIVDTFMVRVQGPDEPRSRSSAKEFIKKMFNAVELVTKVKIRRDVAKEIKGIKERVKEVANRRDRWLISDPHLLI
jgi:disease resistance protein RPM1